MSDIVERTLASFPRLLSSALLGGGKSGQPKRVIPSHSLQALLKAVDSARSHSEEVAVVHRELTRIKHQFEQPNASVSCWSEAFPRIIFCSVLGYDVSFCHIYAVKLLAQGKGRDKRVGYLAATLLLDPGHDITLLTMGSMMKDLTSSNILENLMALCAAAELVNAEHIPVLLPRVVPLLQHKQAMVRTKAVYCAHAFFQRAPALMQQVVPAVKSLLGDRDPGVLSAVVTLIALLVEPNTEEFLPLGMDLINILQQIRDRRFSKSFNYSGIPLPWLQIQLLKILALLGSADKAMATALVPVLSQILNDTVPRNAMSLAILNESIYTIAILTKTAASALGGQGLWSEEERGREEGAVWGKGPALHTAQVPTSNSTTGPAAEMSSAAVAQLGGNDGRMAMFSPLLKEASEYLACFLESDEANLRYLGVKALTKLVSVNIELAVPHQRAVVQCLDDPDLIVRQQTLSLLHHMANPANVKVICSKMLEHIDGGDARLQADIVDMVISISGRLAPDPQWYLHTLLPLLSLPLDPSRLSVIADNMLQFLTRACRDPVWPAFPPHLFSTMVETVLNPLSGSTQTLLFCLRTLRFVSLPVTEGFSGDSLLKACGERLEREEVSVEVKEQTVLCVQALLLQGSLDRLAVLRWATDLLERCSPLMQRRYRQKLLELLRLASLQTSLAFFTGQKPPEQMDFTLSFLDSYAKDMCKVSGPLLDMAKPSRHRSVEAVLRLGDEQSSVFHHPSSTHSNQDESTVCVNSCEHADSSVEEDFSLSSPVVKQLWSKEGFAGHLGEGRGADNSSSAVPDKDEELARALFQGLTASGPPASTLPATLFTQTSPTSIGSSWDSCPSPMVTSSPDTLLASTTDLSLSSRTANADDHAVPSAATLTSQESPVSGWKVLHLAHFATPAASPAEGERQLSDLGSGCDLSISDDSLEDRLPHSSPARPPPGPPGPPSPQCGHGPEPTVAVDRRHSDMLGLLETQMAQYECSLAGPEPPASGGESMYSEFEILAQVAGEWEELGGETKNRERGIGECDVSERQRLEAAEGAVERDLALDSPNTHS